MRQADLEQMMDIVGLRPVSAWPPSIQVVLLSLLALGIATGLAGFYAYRRRIRASWQYAAKQRLAHLQATLKDGVLKQHLNALSKELRFLALKQVARTDCASLTGTAWLAFLERHDPNQFAWTIEGKILLIGPYAPTPTQIETQHVARLIHATRAWMKKL